jgi:predicted ArsR family transcriptional regulator
VTSEAVHMVAALDDPQRARLSAVVRGSAEPMTREDAAAAVGISRKLAAFHLERLVDAGLLEATFDRPVDAPRGIGRSPKRYRAADTEVSVSIPERRYDFAGEILLDAVCAAKAGESPAAAVERVARARGRREGSAIHRERRLGRLGPERAMTVVSETLAGLGFEPAVRGGGLVQRNCPFHHLAQRAPDVVCGINRWFVEGLLDGLGASRLRADLAPEEGRCCVVVRPD